MSSEKTPLENAVDQAMDAFVYAPIGLVFDGPAVFPKLVQQGRNQVQVARMMGQMAVQMGQSKLTERVEGADGPLRDVLVGLGVVAPAQSSEPAPEKSEPAAEPEPSATTAAGKQAPAKKSTKKKSASKKASAKKKSAPKKSGSRTGAAKATSTTAASALGIPDYDSLSASQVVSRLRGLVADELDAVRAYESANRARKTILNKISQLQRD